MQLDFERGHAELETYPDDHSGFDRLALDLGIRLEDKPEDRNTETRVYWIGYADGQQGREKKTGYAGPLLDSYLMGYRNGRFTRAMETGSEEHDSNGDA